MITQGEHDKTGLHKTYPTGYDASCPACWLNHPHSEARHAQSLICADIASLSSGTMATLTGLSSSDDVARVQTAWYQWAWRQDCQWDNWQSAWADYQARK